MAVSYNKLWKLLVDKEMSKGDLRKAIGMSPNTLTKMRKGELISGKFLCAICKLLNCDFGDIISYVPEDKDTGVNHGAE